MTRPDLPITYPVPLRLDRDDPVTGWIVLPADMTAAEAERVCRIVRSLAVDVDDEVTL